MKIKFSLTTLLLFLLLTSNAQRQLWTIGTAYTLGPKDMRISLFQPSAYALTKSFEIQAHPVMFFVAPNLALKKQWIIKEKFALASKHGVVYPTFLLQKMSDADLYSSLLESEQIPGILHFKNELLFSFGWGKVLCPSFTSTEFNRKNTFKGPTKILTFKLGIQNGVQFGDGEMPVLNEKYIFHHTYPYHGLLMYNFGVDYDSRLNMFIDYAIDFDYLLLEGNHHVFEHKTLLNWWVGRKFFHVAVGYQVSYGEYLGEDDLSNWKFFVGPVIDLMWTMRRNRMDLGLFGKKMF
ncbi:MAG: hypothetical protein K9H64_12390 [Bacteroidales bacterium]|nr:hypothetical protein [Bacteroidales bacterium]MCF8456843.1 hypothetical protein [Bacteroidales bacterium]